MLHQSLPHSTMRFLYLRKARRLSAPLLVAVVFFFFFHQWLLRPLSTLQANFDGSSTPTDFSTTSSDDEMAIIYAKFTQPLALSRRTVDRLQADSPGQVGLNPHPDWLSAEQNLTAQSVAWGDVDNDGDLDLAIGNLGQNRIYLNQGRMLQPKATWISEELDCTISVAWGDMDRDGKLDLVVGNGREHIGDSQCVGAENKIYLNQGIDNNGKLQMKLVWQSNEKDNTQSIALGDIDGDNYLDLAVGNGRDCKRFERCTDIGGERNRIYRNLGLAVGNVQMTLVWTSPDEDNTHSVAWGHLDGDGYLDLAVGNGRICNEENQFCSDEGGPNKIYQYGGWDGQSILTMTLAWSDNASDQTMAVAWGDVDGDTDLDLAVGNQQYSWQCNCVAPAPTKIYLNEGGVLRLADWEFPKNKAESLAWGDVNGDGALDLAVGTWVHANTIYLNKRGVLSNTSAWEPASDGDTTYSLALGDVDGDGDLDLATGNKNDPTQVFLNEIDLLDPTPQWTAAMETWQVDSVAWGDVDRDGDLDLAIGRRDTTLRTGVYLNQQGKLQTDSEPHWTSTEQDQTHSIAWGDVDGDGDLDLAAGNYGSPNKIYLNQGIDSQGNLRFITSTIVNDSAHTQSIAWGDVDGDGDLDLAIGNGRADYNCIWKDKCEPTDGETNKIYLNENGQLQAGAAWVSWERDVTLSVAWGDVDNDGDLDLAVGNFGGQNKLYRNDGLNALGYPQMTLSWTSDSNRPTTSVAWGDVDNDGDLDLAAGNFPGQNLVYLNEHGHLQPSATWLSSDTDLTTSIAWADVDGDGDLDLTAGNHRGAEKIYKNQGGILQALSGSNLGGKDDTWSIAWGDFDNDGDLDLAAGNAWGSPTKVYLNQRIAKNAQQDQMSLTLHLYSDAAMTFRQPVTTLAAANFYAVSAIRDAQIIPITYTWQHPDGEAARSIQGFYSLNGGGDWKPAVASRNTVTSNLRSGLEYVFYWDVRASHFFGQSDNVVFLLKAFPDFRPNAKVIAGPFMYPRATAQTYPFRVRGTQVQVSRHTLTATTPVSNAIVYHLPLTETHHARPLDNVSGQPFVTDAQGYLQGRGQIAQGDHLVALLPIMHTAAYTLYHTSATPTVTGLEMYTMTTLGVQTLTVTAANPLLLFNLTVALEWDTRDDARYRERLRADLLRTSELLYRWSSGQAALGNVTIHDNRQAWNDGDIRILASNRLRPNSDLGGVVAIPMTETVQIPRQSVLVTTTLVYYPGQVRMPVVWNRFGAADSSNLGEDWPRALAHELGHYLFFLHDNYLGSDQDGRFVAVKKSACPGVMSDPYRENHFVLAVGWPMSGCENTNSARNAGRADWAAIEDHYPWVITPTMAYTGPNSLPLAVTQITFVDASPPIVSRALAVPIFTLIDDETDEPYWPGRQARAFLFTADRLIDLGRPTSDQFKAWGASSDHRLCLFDPPQQAWGCQTLATDTSELRVKRSNEWQPDITLRLGTMQTIQITITTGISHEHLQVHARLYPINAVNVTTHYTIPLTATTNAYTGEFTNITNTFEAYIHLWANDQRGNTLYELVTDFTIGGNPTPSDTPPTGPSVCHYYNPSGFCVYAPVLSGDGQAMLLDVNINLAAGQFYAIQTVSQIPPPPPWMTVVGQAYRLLTSDGVTRTNASLSLSYLTGEIPTGEEAGLTIYHYHDALNSSSWQPLSTTIQSEVNSAVAAITKPGIYVLMSSVEIPMTNLGWNLFGYPVQLSQPVTVALQSIEGQYRTVYGYDAIDKNDPWKIYDPKLPAAFNDLKALTFGQGYWIDITRTLTTTPVLHLKNRMTNTASTVPYPVIVASSLYPPPATYHGAIGASATFRPSANMTVTAYIDDVDCGTGTTKDVNGEIRYMVKVRAANLVNSNETGCGAPEKLVTFRVGSQKMENQLPWDNSQVQLFDLKAEE